MNWYPYAASPHDFTTGLDDLGGMIVNYLEAIAKNMNKLINKKIYISTWFGYEHNYCNNFRYIIFIITMSCTLIKQKL